MNPFRPANNMSILFFLSWKIFRFLLFFFCRSSFPSPEDGYRSFTREICRFPARSFRLFRAAGDGGGGPTEEGTLPRRKDFPETLPLPRRTEVHAHIHSRVSLVRVPSEQRRLLRRRNGARGQPSPGRTGSPSERNK